jgi:hypothetical protein
LTTTAYRQHFATYPAAQFRQLNYVVPLATFVIAGRATQAIMPVLRLSTLQKVSGGGTEMIRARMDSITDYDMLQLIR